MKKLYLVFSIVVAIVGGLTFCLGFFTGRMTNLEREVNTRWECAIKSGTNQIGAMLPRGRYRIATSLAPIAIEQDSCSIPTYARGTLALKIAAWSGSTFFTVSNANWNSAHIFDFEVTNDVDVVKIDCFVETNSSSGSGCPSAFLLIRAIH